MESGPRRESGRGFGVAAAIAGALLCALLLAAPILYMRIGEARDRLDAILRRAHTVRSQELSRRARVRSSLDRQVGDAADAYDETLASLERGLDRMLPKPITEIRLPEPLPLPPDVTPAVAPIETTQEQEPAVLPEEASTGTAAAPNARARHTAGIWTAQLTRELDLTVAQQERVREVMEEYLTSVEERAARARQGQKENAYQDIQASRERAIQSTEGMLTAEQLARYRKLVEISRKWRAAGVVTAPLPGTLPPRR